MSVSRRIALAPDSSYTHTIPSFESRLLVLLNAMNRPSGDSLGCSYWPLRMFNRVGLPPGIRKE